MTQRFRYYSLIIEIIDVELGFHEDRHWVGHHKPVTREQLEQHADKLLRLKNGRLQGGDRHWRLEEKYGHLDKSEAINLR